MNIFIHHDGALGDVLLSLPAIRSIRRPGDKLHFAGNADIGLFLKEALVIDEASSSSNALYAPLYAGRVPGDARSFLEGFSRAFIFSVRTESPFVDAVRSVISNTLVINTIPPDGSFISATEFRLKQVGGQKENHHPLMVIPQPYLELAYGILSRSGYDGFRRVAAIHPGSGGSSKQWPLDAFLELAKRLIRYDDIFVIMLTGPAEDDAFKDRVEYFTRGTIDAVHLSNPELIAAAAMIGLCGLYIGNDSGMTHLAAALGRPVLALFGPTDPGVWGPTGPSRIEIIHATDLSALAVDTVYVKAHEMLASLA